MIVIELECLKAALKDKTRGWRGVPGETHGHKERFPRQQMAEVVRGDVAAVCDLIGTDDSWVAMKRASVCWGREATRMHRTIVMFADDVFKLVELAEAALAAKV